MKQLAISDGDSVAGALLTLPLFTGVDKALLAETIRQCGFRKIEYGTGEAIRSPTDAKKRIVILLSGAAEVYSVDEARTVLLRKVVEGGVVGVANLFAHRDFVSRVIAVKRCETLEISAEDFGQLLEKDRRLMYNYLAFLSERICFLNRKIVCLAAGSAERRLAYFLDTELPEPRDGADEPREITVQMNSLCEMLNLGRASLYRAADKLCEEGFIRREGKKIVVSDRKGMMEKYR